MNRKKLLSRLLQGAVQNVAFSDLINLAHGFGFYEKRIRGSHHVLAHPKIADILNLQEVGGKGKAYQIRQFLDLVKEYNLKLEARP